MNIISKTIMSAAALALVVGCSSTGEQSSSSSSSSSAAPGGLVVFNGEDKRAGGSWAVTTLDVDRAEVAIEQGEAFSGDSALHFQAAGSQWMGFGWNYQNWAPGIGTDTTKYSNLVFMMKVGGAKPPAPSSVTANMSSAGPGKQGSSFVSVAEYGGASLPDGQWHKITMPIALFVNSPGDNDPLDPTLVNEVGFGAWTEDYLDFEYYVDDIRFE